MYCLQQYFFQKNSHAAPKVGIDYKRAKSGLQHNLRKKNLGILLHVGKTRRTYNLIPGFQKKKARNLPKSSKNLDNFFITFFFKLFLKNFQKVLLTMLLGIFLLTNCRIFPTKKDSLACNNKYAHTYNVRAIEQPQTFLSFWVSQKTCKTLAKQKRI
jgi:hypothetical protein